MDKQQQPVKRPVSQLSDPHLAHELKDEPMFEKDPLEGSQQHGHVFAANPSARKITDAERDLDLEENQIKALDADSVMQIAEHYSHHFTGIHSNIVAQWHIQKSLSEPQLNTMKAFLLTHSKKFKPGQN